MAESDLSFSLVPVDLPAPSMEHGPRDLTDEQFQMDDETKLQLLGPQDENHLISIFGCSTYEDLFAGLFDTQTCKEGKSNLVFADDESEAEQMHHEMAEHNNVPSLLDLPVQYGWGGGRRKCRKPRKSCWANAESNSKLQYVWGGHHGARKCRKKSTSCWAEISHLYGLPKPSARRGTTFGGRKKLKRWTCQEAEMLVEAVSTFGMTRNWKKVKRAYFKTSFRTRVHLKDKWRDFGRACGINVGSKKKVRPQAATRKILEGLEEKIISIYEKDDAEKRRALLGL